MHFITSYALFRYVSKDYWFGFAVHKCKAGALSRMHSGAGKGVNLGTKTHLIREFRPEKFAKLAWRQWVTVTGALLAPFPTITNSNRPITVPWRTPYVVLINKNDKWFDTTNVFPIELFLLVFFVNMRN